MKKMKVTMLDSFKSGYNFVVSPRYIFPNDVMKVIDGVPVVHYNDVIWKDGYMIACMGKAGANNCIYVDDHFLSMPEEVQEFILYHEIGHLYHPVIKSGKMDSLKRTLSIKVSKAELEADRYACKKIGFEQAKKSLQYLVDNTKGRTSKELVKRLTDLKAYMEVVK